MADVYVLGVATTAFRKWPERSHAGLAAEVVRAVLEGRPPVDAAWFGNCAMGLFGQPNIRGQVALDGLLPEGVPVVNVEGGCATGTATLQGAFSAVASGALSVALAVGVEKTWVAHDPPKTFDLFMGGIDQLDPERWRAFHEAEAARLGLPWATHPARILFLDLHALRAAWHMREHGTTQEHLAAVASKNHAHGALNDNAQYRFQVSVEDALADKPVVGPLTRAMCAPISDGAAAVLLGSEPPSEGPVIRVRSVSLAGGGWRGLDQPGVTHEAGRRAWAQSGLRPQDVDVVEVHDATAFCELESLAALGFYSDAQVGPAAAAGETSLGGRLPVNVSGGLESKGHPLAATGLGMVQELVDQLAGRAGARQVPDASIALAQNAGGVIGLDEALAGVTLLERLA
ncbi:MAG: thiolase family protein [Proteobacteria bacterium]|nr:thiolase family protein [Pseudomonadota bacterium]